MKKKTTKTPRLHATSVKLHNVKGRHQIVLLSPLTVIVGENWAGKTAVLDALTVGFVGYHPKLGKRIADTLRLHQPSADNTMEVQIQFSDPNLLNRIVWIDSEGKGTCKDSRMVSLDPIQFSVEDFFELTHEERVRRLLGATGQKLSATEIADCADKVVMLPTLIAGPIKAEWRARVASVMADSKVEEPLDNLTDWLKGQAKLAKAESSIRRSEMQAIANVPRGTFQGDPEADLEAVTAEMAQLATKAAELNAKKQDGQIAENELEKISQAPEPVDFAPLESAQRATEEKQAKIKAELDAARTTYSKLTNNLGDLRARRGTNILALKELKAATCCPTCGNKRMDWRDDMVREYMDRIASQDKAIQQSERDMQDVSMRGMELRKKYDEANIEREGAERQMQTAKARNASAQAVTDADKDRLKKQIAEARDVEPKLKETQDQLNALQAKVQALRKAVVDQACQRHQEKQMTTLEQQLVQSDVRLNVMAETLKALTALKEARAGEAMKPVLDTVRKFTQGILPGEFGYEDGQFGMQHGQDFVVWRTLSGSEQLVALTGLSVALATGTKFKLCLLDEMGRMTLGTRTAVVERLEQLVADGTVDQVICVDTTEEAYLESGFNVQEVK